MPANPHGAAVISHAAKLSLRAYFERVGWPLNKVLPRGEAFSSGDLGMIVREHCLIKTQVSQQLLNLWIQPGGCHPQFDRFGGEDPRRYVNVFDSLCDTDSQPNLQSRGFILRIRL